MQTIMINLLDESEDIQENLLLTLLSVLQREKTVSYCTKIIMCFPLPHVMCFLLAKCVNLEL